MIILSDSQHYSDIANAIRAKNGESTQYKPSEMALAIKSLQGGGIPCTLTVTTEEGATVTATLENTSVSATANADGVAVLILEKEGTWIVSASLDGETKSTEVLVEYNIEKKIIFASVFYIVHNNVRYEYYFEEPMTWADFVASDFNDGNFFIDGTDVMFFNGMVQLNGVSVTASTAMQEANYSVLPIMYIYKAGFTEFKNATIVENKLQSLNFNSDHFEAKGATTTTYFRLVLSADFTNYNKLIFDAYTTGGTYNALGYTSTSTSGTLENTGGGSFNVTSRQKLEVDVSNITGVKYIVIQVQKSRSIYVYDIHFE